MSERTDEQIVEHIKAVLESHVAPAVASHGGHIDFVSYDNGVLELKLGGACSGCAGSTMTLKYGVENMMRHMVPEVKEINAFDDPMSSVDPFYSDPFFDDWESIDLEDEDEHESTNPKV
jgi:Fe-S cluster biogenesis protein NfuA